MPAGLSAYGHAAQHAVLNGLRTWATSTRDGGSWHSGYRRTVSATRAATGVDGTREAVFAHFLFGAAVTPGHPRELGLPLTKKFDGLGWVVMRTGWDDPNATMVTFNASPGRGRSEPTANLNQGAFTINRRGPLVINSGVAVHHSYASDTWSYNTMVFPDPERRDVCDREVPRPRGAALEREPGAVLSQRLLPGSALDIGGIERFQEARPADGLDFDYMFADLRGRTAVTPSRTTTTTRKVGYFTRQFINFRRDRAGRLGLHRGLRPGEDDGNAVREALAAAHDPESPVIDGVRGATAPAAGAIRARRGSTQETNAGSGEAVRVDPAADQPKDRQDRRRTIRREPVRRQRLRVRQSLRRAGPQHQGHHQARPGARTSGPIASR